MSSPMKSHGEAVKRIGRYLLGTRGKGFIMKPDHTKSFECWVDADYSSNWNPLVTDDPNTAKSRSGYILPRRPSGMGIPAPNRICPQHGRGQIYISFDGAPRRHPHDGPAGRDVRQGIPSAVQTDRALQIVRRQTRVTKYRPRTRHINTAWHHFRLYVVDKLISILPVDTKSQVGDVFTKQVSRDDFIRFRKIIFGW
jgi:hypothetical protein